MAEHYLKDQPPPTNPDAAIVSVAYNHASISYVGRWIHSGGVGMWSGWGGSRVMFKIRGTGFLRVFYQVTDTLSNADVSTVLSVDGASGGTKITLSSTADVFTGAVSKTYAIPNDGLDHTIDLYQYGLGSNQFSQAIGAMVTGFEVGSGATISAWTLGATVLHVIGDSWMVAEASWVKMLSNVTYEVYPISNTGYQVATANTNYLLDYTAVVNTSDPTPDKVLISFGVNDFNASVTVNAFQTSLLALIDKIRVRYAAVPIVLVRVTSNGASLYGQYGTAMSNVVGLRTGVTYIDTTTIDASMTWMPDGSHLDASGQAAFASFVNPLI